MRQCCAANVDDESTQRALDHRSQGGGAAASILACQSSGFFASPVTATLSSQPPRLLPAEGVQIAVLLAPRCVVHVPIVVAAAELKPLARWRRLVVAGAPPRHAQ